MKSETQAVAQAFVNLYVLRIYNSSFVTWMEEQRKLGVTVSFGQEGHKVKVSGPDYEEFAAMLLSLRILIQPKDMCSYPKLWKAIEADPDFPDDMRKEIQRSIESIDKYRAKYPILQITIRDAQDNPTVEPMTNGQIFDLLMYGEYVHQNEDKKSLIDRLKNATVFEHFNFEFLCAVWTYIGTLNYIKNALRKAGVESETPEISKTGR